MHVAWIVHANLVKSKGCFVAKGLRRAARGWHAGARRSRTHSFVWNLHSLSKGFAHSSTEILRDTLEVASQRQVRTGLVANSASSRKMPGRGCPICFETAAIAFQSRHVSKLWCSATTAASRSICLVAGKLTRPAKTLEVHRASMSATAQCEPYGCVCKQQAKLGREGWNTARHSLRRVAPSSSIRPTLQAKPAVSRLKPVAQITASTSSSVPSAKRTPVAVKLSMAPRMRTAPIATRWVRLQQSVAVKSDILHSSNFKRNISTTGGPLMPW
mmetsp:Transcript_1983/g.5876  ORF Transcript_1983/g.5876 Transcript_1983/m.5876 type:complete len:272 (+) Transcript_1983:379-1194(+)